MAKQNKFTKSVQERLEQEAARKPKKPSLPMLDLPPQPPEEATPEEPPVFVAVSEPVVDRPPEREEVAEEIAPDKTEATGAEQGSEEAAASSEAPISRADLSAYLQKKEQRVAKNKTFYLDREVCEAIRREAKAAKTTESRLVNDILRAVLGLGTH